MPDKTRFERELDEILEKSEDSPKQRRRKRTQFEPFSPTAPKKRPPKVTRSIKFDPGYVVMLGVLALAIAAFGSIAETPIAIAGAALIAIGFVLWFRMAGSHRVGGGPVLQRRSDRSGKSTTTNEPEVKYWRGQRIEEKPTKKPPPNPDDRGKIIDFGTPDPRKPDDD